MNIFDSWLVNQHIAHRGFFNYTDAPENSLKAFQRAIDKNFAIELDVHLLSDGTVAVFHDSELSRVTGKDGYIENLTAKDLKNCFLQGSNQTIPTLKEVFDLVKGKVPIMIEIKSTSSAVGKLEEALLNVMKEYKGDVAVQSFNPFSIEWFSKNAPQYWRGILSSYFAKDTPGRPKSALVRGLLKRLTFFKRAKPHFINYDLRHLPNRYVNKIIKKHSDIPLLGWVVYNQEQYLTAVQLVDNVVFQDFEPKI